VRIVVTGHTGFVGKHLLRDLEEHGWEVIGLSRSGGKDVTQKSSFEDLGRFDVLIHLAAQSFVPSSFREPERFYYDNFIGTLNCLEACRSVNARMIFLSSYVYGQPQFLPITEAHPVVPSNPYMQSKHLGEQLCEAYHRDFKVPVCIIRPFNIYGKGQEGHFLIPTIINQIPTGEIRLKDPRPKRDFVHVEDLCQAIIRLLNADNDFSIYNIGSGESVSIGEIIDILKSNFLIDAGKVFFSHEERTNEVLETRADISKACKDLGWKPTRNFAEELVKIATEKRKSKPTI
jgi:UDP-glucose 4-epimerase